MRVIDIAVDLTEASRCLLHVRVHLPVQPGAVTVFTTPVWIQEMHSPTGPVAGLAGLHISSKGRKISWRRNPMNATEYCVDVPQGVDTLVADFDAVITSKFTRRMVRLAWEHVLLYPARRDIGKIAIQASVTIPDTWSVGTALENLGDPVTTMHAEEGTKTLRYGATNVQRLADSPVIAGLHFSRTSLTADGRHILCIAADTQESAAVPKDALDKLSRLVHQTWATLGARHYDRFFFLLALSNYYHSYQGFEHHDSFEASLPGATVSDPSVLDQYGPLITHEFIHSWCGKYRRPAGHIHPDFARPLDGRLLWVYEGLSTYYEGVISVRCGIMSPVTYRAKLAQKVAWVEGQAGRLWRSLEDTGTGGSLNPDSAWSNWTRGHTDCYNEGTLLWLDVDTLIRAETKGERSLDDFALAFFGQGKATGPKVVPYTLEDIVSALNKVLCHDWESFFRMKVLDVLPRVNLDGIHRAGCQFRYTENPTTGQETEAWTRQAVWNSLGITISEDGRLEDVKRGGPADVAKLAPRQTLAVVGRTMFTLDALVAEVRLSRLDCSKPIRLTVTQEHDVWEVEVDYHGGLRYPQVERRVEEQDMFSIILAPKHVDQRA